MTIKHIAVVGAGTIGASWAAYFLSRGLQVTATDPNPAGEAFLRNYVASAWPVLAELGGMVAGASPEALRYEADMSKAVAGVDFVQESGPERELVKQALYKELDAALPAEVLIASSSSGLIMSRIQTACARHPERCVIGHPFNPPHMIPLVEVVGGALTSPATIAQAMDFYRGIGKHPIHIRKEKRGHIANRLQSALWREAINLLAEDVASVADIDAAITQGPGLRWAIFGPHMTFHLGGGVGGMEHFLSQLLGPNQDWWEDMGTPDVTPALQRKIIEGVLAEAAGRDIPALAAERDRHLVEILKSLKS